ncbi:MAG: virulence factor, partial [Gammaproteobacteria bacterium]|nr:virulence factor [Gammaproteobacteria bacterium]
GSSAAYLADWRRSEPRAVSGDLSAAAAAEAARLEAQYSDEDLEQLIRSHGLAHGSAAPGNSPAGGERG